MKKAIDHNIQAKIVNQSPEICLEVIYQDDFTNDHYVLSGADLKQGSKNINFEVQKNGNKITSIEMTDRNVENFLNEFLKITKDADFNSEFKTKIYETSSKQISDFFEFFDNSIISKGLTLEGEISRMKKMAGIIKS